MFVFSVVVTWGRYTHTHIDSVTNGITDFLILNYNVQCIDVIHNDIYVILYVLNCSTKEMWKINWT